MNQYINNNRFLKKLKSPFSRNKRTLDPEDARLFFSVMDKLDIFVGDKSGIFQKAKAANKPVDIYVLRKQIRDHWYANLWLIDRFIQSRDDLTQEQKDLLLSWKRRICGNLMCLKVYSEFAVFASMESSSLYYAVRAISDDFEDLVRMKAPYIVATALLPFKDMIIWDGLVGMYPLQFGKEARTAFEEEVTQHYKNGTLITRLT